MRLFKLVATNGSIDWLITNELDENLTTQIAKANNDLRWQIEEFHRDIKQLTGSQKCQCRITRSQRNHLTCGYQASLSLKITAQKLNISLYQLRHSLFFGLFES